MSLLSILLIPYAAFAQADDNTWETQVRQFDARYWKAFNDCEVGKLASMNTPDLEFYHDVGGFSKGVAQFANDVANNVCGHNASQVRREAVAESVHIYPLRDREKLYGAIITGNHRFYEKPSGGKEVLAEQARFTHVLLFQKGQWKVARVMSFEHTPVP